jgi:hypothetical protein
VIKVEGLHSYKAIAFIKSEGNPRITCLKTKTYFTLRISLQKITNFSEIFQVSFGNITRSSFNEKLGDEKWIK